MKSVVRNTDELLRFCNRVMENLGGDFNAPYTVSFVPFKRPRSLDQNAKLHAMLRDLSMHTGYTEKMMKELVKAQFGPLTTIQVGGKSRAFPKETSEYSVDEMSDLIEHIYKLGAEIGCQFTQTGEE